MGLSLSVLVALLLVLPGVAFFFGLSRLHRANKPATALDNHVSIGLAITVAAAIVFQSIGIAFGFLLNLVFGTPEPNIGAALLLLAGQVVGEDGKNARAAVETYPLLIAGHQIALAWLGWACGKSANHRFRKGHNADWYELLRPRDEVAFIWLTADISVGSCCFLYAGVVTEFSIDATGALRRVVLLGANRKPIPYKPTEPPDEFEGWVDIPGEFCVLDLRTSSTVNIDYWYPADPDGEPESDAPPEGEASQPV